MTPKYYQESHSEKAVAFIVARLSSSRLPAKQLRAIGDKAILEWTLENLNHSQQIDQVVIATVEEEENLPLKKFAQDNEISCFWYHGEVNHVTTRLRQAAELYAADICLLISGDCPLLSAQAIDEALIQFRTSPDADVVAFTESNHQSCMMEGINIARKRAWQRADDMSIRPEQKEHQFPVIAQQAHLFSWLSVKLSAQYYATHHRMSVDTPADLEFMNTLHRLLSEKNLPFNLEHALELLEKEPSLKKINQHVYQRQLIELNNRALFIVDAGGTYGMGHLMRCMELATRLVENNGWAVTFLVDDADARRYLERKGFRTAWGAFGRSVRYNSQGFLTTQAEAAGEENSLIIIDIFDQRGLALDWRKSMNPEKTVIAIGNTLKWTKECDLLIMPGLSNIPEEFRHSTQNSPQLISGLDQLILRRAITRQRPETKDIDLLVYLHSSNLRNSVAETAQSLSLRHIILNEFSDKMPELLARAKFLLSGFGISCYEALSLKTYPICSPHSDINMRDALYFYNQIGLPPKIIQTPEQISGTLSSLPEFDHLDIPDISDQTDSIVTTILNLLTKKLDRANSGKQK